MQGILVVELRGFEPLTSCMPCKRSAELSYSPKKRLWIVSGFSRCGFVGNSRGIRPQPLQLVVVPGLLVEDVYHQVAVVEQHPPRVLPTFTSQWLPTRLVLQLLLDFIAQGAYVSVRSPRRDDEHIGHYEEFRNVEQRDI